MTVIFTILFFQLFCLMCTLEVVKFYEEQQSTGVPPSIPSPALDGSGRVSDRRDAAQSVEHVCVSQVLAGRRSKKKKRCAVYSIRRRRKERATRREICSPTAARFASKGPNLI